MKIINLGKNQHSQFSFLAPPEKSALLKLPGYEAVGGIAPPFEGDPEEEFPCALMILSYEPGERLVIEWLYVAEDFRGQSLGEGLLARAYEIAAEGNLPELSVRFEGRLAHLRYDHPLEVFFRDRYFDRGYKMPGMWRITAEEADELLNKTESGKEEGERPIPVKELLPKERTELLSRIRQADDADCIVFQPVETGGGEWDPETSWVKKNGDKITAALLLGRAGRAHMALTLYGTGRKEMKELLLAALDGLADGLMDETMEFRFRTRLDRDELIALFPEIRVTEVLYLTADTTAFLNNENRVTGQLAEQLNSPAEAF